MNDETCASPILGWNEKSNKHSCILFVILVLPSSLFCKSFMVTFLSMKVFLNKSIAPGIYSSLDELINIDSNCSDTLNTLITFSLQVRSIAIVHALTNSSMFY